MAVGVALLDTLNARKSWALELIKQSQPMSNYSWLEGEGRGEGTVIYVSKDLSVEGFRTESVSIADGQPVTSDELLRENTSGLVYKAVEGFRAEIAYALAMKKITQSQTARSIVNDSVASLAPHWARQNDALMSNYMSAYNNPIKADYTTAELRVALDPSNATNLTAMKLILNLSGIGSSSVSDSTYLGWNAYSGLLEGNYPRTVLDENTWNNALAAPADYTLKVNSLAGMVDYERGRGVQGVGVDASGFPNVPRYMLMAPRKVYSMMRMGDPKYERAVVSGDLSAEEMWKGKMRFETVEGVILKEADYTFPDSPDGVTGNSPFRMEESTDGLWWVIECQLFGAQALSVSKFDEPTVAIGELDQPNALKRKPIVGYSVIRGAVQIERTSTPESTAAATKTYRQVTSVILTMRK